MSLTSWFGGDSNEAQAHSAVKSGHKAEWSHELIAGAASYEAAKAYEKHCAENGKPASHTEAKEIMAGIIGAFVDREVETKGLDFIDREKAKRDARNRANEALTQSGEY